MGRSLSSLHTTLLIYLMRIMHPAASLPAGPVRLTNMRRLLAMYLATPAFLRAAFAHEAGLEEPAEEVLEMLYEAWRRRDGEGVEASIVWATWLLARGQGARATAVVRGTRGTEERWLGLGILEG